MVSQMSEQSAFRYINSPSSQLYLSKSKFTSTLTSITCIYHQPNQPTMQVLSTTAILFAATALAAPPTAKTRNINPPDGFIALYNQANCPASGLENGHFSIGFEDNSCIPL